MSGAAAEPRAPSPAPFESGLRLAIALLLAAAPTVIANLFRSGTLDDEGSRPSIQPGWWLALGGGLVVVFALLRPPIPWRPLAAGRTLRTFAPFFAGWVVLLVVYLRAMHALGRPIAPQAGLEALRAPDPGTVRFWLDLGGTLVLAPLAEEVFFRGYLHGFLRDIAGRGAAVLVTAALFGLMHTLPYALPLAVLGLFLGWLRERRSALLPCVLVHATSNAIVVACVLAWPGVLDVLYPR